MNVIRNMLETAGLPLIKWLKDLLIANRPVLIEFADKLPKIIENQVIPAIEDFVGVVKDAATVITPIIATIISGFKAFGEAAGPIFQRIQKAAQPVIDKVFKWIEDHGAEIHKALKIIAAGFVALIAVKAVLIFVGTLAAILLTLLNPITLITTAILAFAGAWILNWENIRTKTIKTITTLKTKIVEGVATIKAAIMPHLQPLIDVLGKLIPLLPEFATAFASGFAEVAKNVVPVLGAVVVAGTKLITEVLQWVVDKLITEVLQWVVDNQEMVTKALKALGAAFAVFLIISTIVGLITGAAGLVAAIIGLLNPVTLVIAAIALLAGVIITNWEKISTNVQAHAERIKNNVFNMVISLIEFLAPFGRAINNFIIFLGMVGQAVWNTMQICVGTTYRSSQDR
jgi:hypothetical protein